MRKSVHTVGIIVTLLATYSLPFILHGIYQNRLQRIRETTAKPSHAYSAGEYSSPCTMDTPLNFEMVVVRRDGGQVEETYYLSDMRIVHRICQGTDLIYLTQSAYLHWFPLGPSLVAGVYLYIVLLAGYVGRIAKRTPDRQIRWSKLTEFEKVSVVYGLTVFSGGIIFFLTGLWGRWG